MSADARYLFRLEDELGGKLLVVPDPVGHELLRSADRVSELRLIAIEVGKRAFQG